MDDEKFQVKGISAPPDWWERLEQAQRELGVNSRSNLVRIAVDDYLKDNLADNRETATLPA